MFQPHRFGKEQVERARQSCSLSISSSNKNSLIIIMSSSATKGSSSLLSLLLIILLFPSAFTALSLDGTLLLSFKYAVLSDPLNALANWNYDDYAPCSWNGVICTGFPDLPVPATNASTTTATTTSRVISLVLPNSQLLGSVPSDLGLIPHLRHLDLSNNFLNGTLPTSLFNISELKILSLANNEISGELTESIGGLAGLQLLNLSDNALVGSVPRSLTLLPNLTVVSLKNNYISGQLPGGGFGQLRFLDLSSNLVNGTVPGDFGVSRMQYLNLSYNRISGEIPSGVGSRIPADAAVDLSFNNFAGGIPQSAALLAQKPAAFAGNPELCGKPLRNLCTIPSTLSNLPNATTSNPTESPPALAAIPKTAATADGSSQGAAAAGGGGRGGGGFKPATIAAIVIGDLGGIGLLFVAFLYVYHVKKKKKKRERREAQPKQIVGFGAKEGGVQPSPSPEPKAHGGGGGGGGGGGLPCCMRKKDGDEEETSETSSSSEAETEEEQNDDARKAQAQQNQQGATLVTVDGDVALEMETLLKASAYILGATGTTIVYKAVLADGTALAVRRIGENSAVDKLKDFEAQVRSIAKFRHPNLLRIWGFYWGPDEKLLIHDYASSGSLANISFSKKLGSSPFHLGLEARLRIARGVARGLAYIHEKKSVHGNLKPSNILLGADMEARIGDFGLDRLLFGDGGSKLGASARLFGSKRSMQSHGSLPDLSPVTGASPIGSSLIPGPSSVPYQAPESLKNLKPNAKWDVYSFGMVLLELISGRLFSEEELCQWNAGFIVEERNRIIRMADPALQGEVEGKEEALLSCFKLGFACAAMAPQRRPSMKDVAMLLDRIPSAPASSSTTASLLY